jgi:hypothetical protein
VFVSSLLCTQLMLKVAVYKTRWRAKENTGLSEASRINGRSVSLIQLSSNRLLYTFWFNNALDHILHLSSHLVLHILDSKQKRKRNTKKYNIEKVSKLPWKIREKKRVGYIIMYAIYNNKMSFSLYLLIDLMWIDDFRRHWKPGHLQHTWARPPKEKETVFVLWLFIWDKKKY